MQEEVKQGTLVLLMVIAEKKLEQFSDEEIYEIAHNKPSNYSKELTQKLAENGIKE